MLMQFYSLSLIVFFTSVATLLYNANFIFFFKLKTKKLFSALQLSDLYYFSRSRTRFRLS